MQIKTNHISSLTYLLCCFSLLYAAFAFSAGLYTIGSGIISLSIIYFIAFWFNYKKNVINNLIALYAASGLSLLMLDDGLRNNSGFILFYIPLLLSGFLFFSSNKPYVKFIVLGYLVLLFAFVNYSNFTPKWMLEINSAYENGFMLYFNTLAAIALTLNIILNFDKIRLTAYNELTENQANFKALIENTPDHIWAIDNEYNLLAFNKPYAQVFKSFWGIEPTVGQPLLFEGDKPELRAYWKTQYDKVLLGNRFKIVKDYVINNQTVIFEFSFNPVLKNNLVDGAVISASNITQKKLQEDTEKQTLYNLELLISSTEDVIFELDENNVCVKVWCSDISKLIYPIDFFINKNVAEIFDQPFKINLLKIVNQVKETGNPINTDYSFKYNGEIKHFTAKVRLVKNSNPTKASIIVEDITERKQNLIEQNKQREFLDKLIDNLPVGIFSKDVNNNGAYTLWNKELERLFGLKQEDVIGKTDYEVFANMNQIDAYAKTDDMVIESKEPLLISKLNIGTNHGTIIARTIKIPILDKQGNVSQVIGILENITEITHAQDELSAAEFRWNYALTGSRDAVWDINLETEEVYYSPIFKQLLGYAKNENPELDLDSLIHPDDIDYVNKMYDDHLEGKIEFYETEYRIRKKDNSYLWILDRGKVCDFDEEGYATRIIGTFADITYRKQLEEQLIAAKEKAEDASKAKSLFLSTMSHEIRTPMNAVAGIINLIIQDHPKPEHQEHLQSLKFSSDNLMYLLNDILDFSKIDAGRLELEDIEFNVTKLTQNILQTFTVKAKEKQVELTLNIDPEIPSTLIGDPVRLSQILSNLVSNAVKFTNQGNVLLEVMLRSKNDQEVHVEFAVSDTGIGIDKEKLDTIFDAFSQAQLNTTRRFGGTGLGLAISKKLTEIFGSKIYVTSAPDMGSKFWFTLKLPYLNKVNIEPTESLVDYSIVNLKGMKVLVAEDNKLNLFVITKFLKSWGVAYDVAENGLETINLFKLNKYDLVLMDLQMPEMDGTEATKIIRKFNTTTPIFALTANALSDVKEEVMAIGMNDFITKPFEPNELLKKLGKVYTEQKKLPVNLKLFN